VFTHPGPPKDHCPGPTRRQRTQGWRRLGQENTSDGRWEPAPRAQPEHPGERPHLVPRGLVTPPFSSCCPKRTTPRRAGVLRDEAQHARRWAGVNPNRGRRLFPLTVGKRGSGWSQSCLAYFRGYFTWVKQLLYHNINFCNNSLTSGICVVTPTVPETIKKKPHRIMECFGLEETFRGRLLVQPPSARRDIFN